MPEVQASHSSVASFPAELSSSGVEKDALITRLDTLLEQYLHTLDEYEKLMQQLSKELSSGFFSLTQANFHNRSGIQYGQDSYDERVQATARIVVTENENSRLNFSTTVLSPSTTASQDKDSQSGPAQTAEEEQGEKSEEGATEADRTPEDQDAKPRSQSKGAEENASKVKPAVVDPIRMFGILVPPALRSAQTSFKEAVNGSVVKLAEITGELKALEREIGRTRKSIRKA